MAKYIAKKISKVLGPGTKILWELCPPLDGFGLVVTSAVSTADGESETYIFAANDKGEIVSWSELKGSYRGGLSHTLALTRAGYSIEGVSNGKQ